MGGGGGLARRPESKIPKYLSKNSNIRKMLKSYLLNILKVQSESSRISNLVQIFIFTENCTPIIHMNHFSYHLTIVQINIFEEPQSIFSQPKFPDPKLSSQPPPPYFNYRVVPLGVIKVATNNINTMDKQNFCKRVIPEESDRYMVLILKIS